jgi:F-type H+-transporting ATPase subunit b
VSINATLFAQMLVFGLLVWFTMKFVWPYLLKAMHDRETRIADGLAMAERGRMELEHAEKRVDEMLREGRDKSQEYLTQAQRRADEMVEEAKQTAREEGERLVKAARAQIEQERIQAREQLRREVAALAMAGAEQILMREVDAKVHAETLERLSARF